MGLIVLDAGVVIGLLDAGDSHHAGARAALTALLADAHDLVLPASAYAECLVSPSRRGPDAVAIVDQFLDTLPARIEPVSRTIAAAAAGLRARHGPALRLPDALVVATALELDAEAIVTTDARWPSLTVRVSVVS
jgi:predicted nucleic acid-binding protein